MLTEKKQGTLKEERETIMTCLTVFVGKGDGSAKNG